MSSKFKITIPKPCHENWNTMTPKEKGRFCSSCSKTVVDFTKKTTEEIENYVTKHKSQRICGHFYKKQLDTIVIEVPQISFQQQLPFQKLFVLSLFFVMGTSLFSCQYADGKKQKIEEVVIIDSLKNIKENIDSLKRPLKKDTIITEKNKTTRIPPTPISTIGITIYETGVKEDSTNNLKNTKDIIEVIETTGELTIEGDIDYNEEIEDDIIMGYIIEDAPRFKESKNLTKEAAKKYFDKRIQSIIQENFDITVMKNLGLQNGKYKIFTQFTIDKDGNTTAIKVKAPHTNIEKEVRKILQKLPQFIPGKQAGKVVKTKYTLPISFLVEE
ncbi:energy transducer TonB [Polaribacter sp.]|uniref:energy transducer TonB n=1 Tax=Polaribacter sp. TaxID=1920175 RepID=UPI003F6AAAE2